MSGYPQSAERGSATVELVVLMPLLVGFLCLLGAAGRVALAEAQVEGAARDAARNASLTRNRVAAQQAAESAARENLANQHITCRELTVTTDLHAFRPGGTVAVTVTCTASLAGLTVAGIPGSKTVTAREVATIDRLIGAF
jgi:Flp pilus assembly protein TadG